MNTNLINDLLLSNQLLLIYCYLILQKEFDINLDILL